MGRCDGACDAGRWAKPCELICTCAVRGSLDRRTKAMPTVQTWAQLAWPAADKPSIENTAVIRLFFKFFEVIAQGLRRMAMRDLAKYRAMPMNSGM
jgi:hypothetical protein